MSRVPSWMKAAMPSEIRHVESLTIQIEAAEAKARPALERLSELREKRKVIRNRAYQRGAYQRRKGKSSSAGASQSG